MRISAKYNYYSMCVVYFIYDVINYHNIPETEEQNVHIKYKYYK